MDEKFENINDKIAQDAVPDDSGQLQRPFRIRRGPRLRVGTDEPNTIKVAAPQQEHEARELPPTPPHHVRVARSPAPSSATERDPSDTGPSTLISNLCIAYRQTCERNVHKSHPDGYNTTTCRGRCGDTEATQGKCWRNALVASCWERGSEKICQ